jgi:hypothetical protein
MSIFYETTKIKNMVMVHVAVHYPGEFPEPDTASTKQKLAVLNRAKHRIDEQVKQLKEQIKQEEIRASGQIDLEKAIQDEVEHVRNKNGYQ